MTSSHKLPARVALPNGDIFVLALFKVQSRDEDGRPEELTFIPGDRFVELVGGEEFVTCYVREGMVQKA